MTGDGVAVPLSPQHFGEVVDGSAADEAVIRVHVPAQLALQTFGFHYGFRLTVLVVVEFPHHWTRVPGWCILLHLWFAFHAVRQWVTSINM